MTKLNANNHDHNSNLIEHLSIGFVCFGILARLAQYFNNRSLWFDEASLALNIVNRSYLELLNVLDYNQAAPPFFLWIEKLSVQLFGNHEYSLRLFPLISGIAALLLFYRMAILLTSGITTLIAIALFSSLRYIVYYSAEVKQYATDLMLAILLFLVLFSLRDRLLKPAQVLLLALLGSISIWTSHPTIFVLVGVEFANLSRFSAQNLKESLLRRSLAYVAWLVSFLLLYVFTIRRTEANANLLSYWDGSYPDSPLDVSWLLDAFGRFFYRPLGFLGMTDGIAIFAFICGCVVLFRKSKSDLFLLSAPFLITLIASFLHKYPFRERLILFLTPFAILIISKGVSALFTPLNQRDRKFKIVGVLVAVVLLGVPLFQAGRNIAIPHRFEEVRPVIEYVTRHQNPGDDFYIFPEAHRQFLYYARRYGYPPKSYILGNFDIPKSDGSSDEQWQRYKQEIRQLKGRQRVWFLLSRSASRAEKILLSDLDQLGKKLDIFNQPDAIACLYDLS